MEELSSVSSHNSLPSLDTNSVSLEGCEIKDSPYKIIGPSIAAGSFGQIHLTKNVKTNEMVATKLLHKDIAGAKLKKEYDWYRILGPMPGLPKIFFFGECGPYDCMIMELLGPNLERVFAQQNYRFSIRTTTLIAIKILNIMQYVHSKKIIFCNVKPENFCVGHPKTPQSSQVFMIGFIHARWFEKPDSGHIPKTRTENIKKEKSGVFGTPRYMSLNAHKGKELSRRDDLESIGYMLLYFINGKLPWQGLYNANHSGYDKYEQIGEIKKMTSLEDLCANLPTEYYHYMLYVRTLKFAQDPNYKYLIQMFTRLLNRINSEQSRLLTNSDTQWPEWSEWNDYNQTSLTTSNQMNFNDIINKMHSDSNNTKTKQVKFKDEHN